MEITINTFFEFLKSHEAFEEFVMNTYRQRREDVSTQDLFRTFIIQRGVENNPYQWLIQPFLWSLTGRGRKWYELNEEWRKYIKKNK